MKRIVLFRYHHQFPRNFELLSFVKFLNPTVSIYGLYGGPEDQFKEASSILEPVLSGNYAIRTRSREWKWKHSDMAYQLWFREAGVEISFDVVHVLEWDMLLFSSLEKLFPHASPDSILLTSLTPMRNVERKWYWTREGPNRAEWLALLDHFKAAYSYDDEPYAALGGGATLPRVFLERLTTEEIPHLSNDEIRIPLLAQVLGVRLVDSGLCRRWFSRREDRVWNAVRGEIKRSVIVRELRKRHGRRAFHPIMTDLSFEELRDLYAVIPT